MTAPLLSTAEALRELGIGRRELGWLFLRQVIEPAEIDPEGRCHWRADEIEHLRDKRAERAERAAVTKSPVGPNVTAPDPVRIDELEHFRQRFACMIPVATATFSE